jgi:hypothetical protein
LGKFRSISRLDLVIGTFSQALVVGSSLVLLPFAVTKLPSAELGVWYIFLTIQALIGLLDFGLTDTFSRFFAYVFAGAVRIGDGEVPEVSKKGHVDLPLLAELLRLAKVIYLCISVLALIPISILGSYYILSVTAAYDLTASVWPAWTIFAVSLFTQTYFQWQSAPLIGSGRTRRNYEIAVRSRVAQVIFTIGALYVNPSLLSMALGFALSVVTMRIDYHFAIRPLLAQAHLAAGCKCTQEDLMAQLFRSSRKLGSTVIGPLLANRLAAMIIAMYTGLGVYAQYAIASQACIALTAVAFVPATMLGPRTAEASVKGDRELIKSIFAFNVAFGWIVFAVGGLLLIFAVPVVFDYINSKTQLPQPSVLILLLLTFFLDMTMFQSTKIITLVANTVPYWKAMLITGASTVAAVLIAGMLGGDLFTLVAAQLFAQASYNYWRWPAYSLNLLKMKLHSFATYSWKGAALIVGPRAH